MSIFLIGRPANGQGYLQYIGLFFEMIHHCEWYGRKNAIAIEMQTLNGGHVLKRQICRNEQ